eukprot:3809751-Prymnesium_polylepis.1
MNACCCGAPPARGRRLPTVWCSAALWRSVASVGGSTTVCSAPVMPRRFSSRGCGCPICRPGSRRA